MRLSDFLAVGAFAGIVMMAGAAIGDAVAACDVQLPETACGAGDAATVAAEPAKAPVSAGRQASPPGLGKLSDAGFFSGLDAFLATKGVDASVAARNLEDILPVSP